MWLQTTLFIFVIVMMKKTFILLILLFVLSLSAFAGISNKKIEWYYNPTCDGTRPSGAVEAHFLSEYDAHYIGKAKHRTEK